MSKIIKERIELQLASNKRCKLVRGTKLSCSFSHLRVHWQIPLKHEHCLFLYPESRSFLLLCEAYLYVPESSFFMSAQINKAELFPENLWQNSCRPLIFIHAHFAGTGEATFYVCLGISQHFLSFPCRVQLCFSLDSFYLTKEWLPTKQYKCVIISQYFKLTECETTYHICTDGHFNSQLQTVIFMFIFICFSSFHFVIILFASLLVFIF